MAVKRYNGSSWDVVAGLGAQGPVGTSSSIATWVKTASGGETSLSGNDDSNQSLSYAVGQELVFINGALQKRGADYTATTGTSITGLNALAAGDVVTVWTVNAFSVTNAISSGLVTTTGDIIYASAANTPARLGIGSTGQVLKVSGGIPSWGTDTSGGVTLITTTSFSGATTGNVDSVFSSTYTNYMVVLSKWNSAANAELLMRLRNGSTTETSANYYGSAYGINSNATLRSDTYSAGTSAKMGFDNQTGSGFMVLYITGVGNSSSDIPNWTGNWSGTANYSQLLGGQRNISGTLYTGLQFLSSSGNVSATVSVYGLVK